MQARFHAVNLHFLKAFGCGVFADEPVDQALPWPTPLPGQARYFNLALLLLIPYFHIFNPSLGLSKLTKWFG